MKEVINAVDEWLAAEESEIALATVITTWGSAPRKVGAKMAFTAEGRAIAGSVSGGCVEGAVIEAGNEVLATGRPQLLHFGVADETAWGVGLGCGGQIDVFVERLDADAYAKARERVIAHLPVTTITVIRGSDDQIGRHVVVADETISGTLGAAWDQQAVDWARQTHNSASMDLPDGVELFVNVMRPSPALILVGGAHVAIALAELAKILGYRTVVIDPRRAFGSQSRFPAVDKLLPLWPDKAFEEIQLRSDMAVVTLTHDPKIDDPALRAALTSDVFYIGALGSRTTHARRRERLSALGFTEEQLARIHAPVGLAIGANNPEEIALAIMAEVVAVYRNSPDGTSPKP
ncbi:MAG: XdhC family protein [Candidatus Promineofilum sp.]|nr:XdhC family protein [Promineifilum sp.]